MIVIFFTTSSAEIDYNWLASLDIKLIKDFCYEIFGCTSAITNFPG